jgi:hypothetical protein
LDAARRRGPSALGEYRTRIRIDPRDFTRHDEINRRRFAEPVEVQFAGVKVERGQG